MTGGKGRIVDGGTGFVIMPVTEVPGSGIGSVTDPPGMMVVSPSGKIDVTGGNGRSVDEGTGIGMTPVPEVPGSGLIPDPELPGSGTENDGGTNPEVDIGSGITGVSPVEPAGGVGSVGAEGTPDTEGSGGLTGTDGTVGPTEGIEIVGTDAEIEIDTDGIGIIGASLELDAGRVPPGPNMVGVSVLGDTGLGLSSGAEGPGLGTLRDTERDVIDWTGLLGIETVGGSTVEGSSEVGCWGVEGDDGGC